jgi:hypothetical protein
MIGEGLIPGADVTRQQRLVVDAPLVKLAETNGEAGIERRGLEQVVQRRSRVEIVGGEQDDRARALEVRLDLCRLSTRAVCQPLIRPVPLAALVGQRQAGASH